MIIETKIVDLNQRMLQAEEAGPKDDLAKLLDGEFTIIRANGVKQDRQAFLDAVPDNAHRDRIAKEPEIHVYHDCAVVILRVTTSEHREGALMVRHFWNMRVFLRREGDWRCAAWQVTETKD